MQKKASWNLKSIILLTLISIICGIIFWLSGYIYNLIDLGLTPLGLHSLSNDASLGLFILAGPLAGAILRRPGAALFGEVLGGIVEMLIGSQWGVMDVVYGIIQGIGAEAGFAITGYRSYSHFNLTMGAIFTTIITFGWDLFQNGYASYHFGLLIVLFIVRFISVWIFSDPFPTAVNKLLKRSNVMNR